MNRVPVVGGMAHGRVTDNSGTHLEVATMRSCEFDYLNPRFGSSFKEPMPEIRRSLYRLIRYRDRKDNERLAYVHIRGREGLDVEDLVKRLIEAEEALQSERQLLKGAVEELYGAFGHQCPDRARRIFDQYWRGVQQRRERGEEVE